MWTKSGLLAAILITVPANSRADPPATVLLLDNQRVLQGQIDRIGEQYRVRRDGGETLVPAGRVLCVCADINAAYAFLRAKVAAGDTAGHLRLARWCDANELRDRAAAEAKVAADLAPNAMIVRTTYEQFRRKADAPPPKTAPAVLPPSILSSVDEPIECGAEAFKRFATRVQPVLMNTCVACHAGTYAGKFRLERVYADGATARAATQHNLAATLALVDRTKPTTSPLLVQATTPHGGAPLPPLRDRGVPAFKQLEEWVRLTVGDSSPPPAPTTEPPVVSTSAAEPKSDFGAANAKKAEPAGPKDPFDAAIFNQQHHPEAPKP